MWSAAPPRPPHTLKVIIYLDVSRKRLTGTAALAWTPELAPFKTADLHRLQQQRKMSLSSHFTARQNEANATPNPSSLSLSSELISYPAYLRLQLDSQESSLKHCLIVLGGIMKRPACLWSPIELCPLQGGGIQRNSDRDIN